MGVAHQRPGSFFAEPNADPFVFVDVVVGLQTRRWHPIGEQLVEQFHALGEPTQQTREQRALEVVAGYAAFDQRAGHHGAEHQRFPVTLDVGCELRDRASRDLGRSSRRRLEQRAGRATADLRVEGFRARGSEISLEGAIQCHRSGAYGMIPGCGTRRWWWRAWR